MRKKILVATLLLSTLTFVSCQSKGGESGQTPTPIVETVEPSKNEDGEKLNGDNNQDTSDENKDSQLGGIRSKEEFFNEAKRIFGNYPELNPKELTAERGFITEENIVTIFDKEYPSIGAAYHSSGRYDFITRMTVHADDKVAMDHPVMRLSYDLIQLFPEHQWFGLSYDEMLSKVNGYIEDAVSSQREVSGSGCTVSVYENQATVKITGGDIYEETGDVEPAVPYEMDSYADFKEYGTTIATNIKTMFREVGLEPTIKELGGEYQHEIIITVSDPLLEKEHKVYIKIDKVNFGVNAELQVRKIYGRKDNVSETTETGVKSIELYYDILTKHFGYDAEQANVQKENAYVTFDLENGLEGEKFHAYNFDPYLTSGTSFATYHATFTREILVEGRKGA